VEGVDLLANVVVKAETHHNTESKYFQLLTAMCQERQQLLVELFHVVLDKNRHHKMLSLYITSQGIGSANSLGCDI